MAKLYNKRIIKGKIRLLSGLHIGSGYMSIETDATVMKDVQNKPFIPGSSLKGLFRTISERLHHLILDNVKTEVCYLAENECSRKTSVKEEIEKLEIEEDIVELIEREICPICQLYGSTFQASKIVFHDAKLIEENKQEQYTTVRHSVKINRETGAAEDGAKYDYEVVYPNTTFSFEIEAENLSEIDSDLLAIALGQCKTGNIQIGGKTSRGLGFIQLEDVKEQRFDLTKPEGKAAYLRYILGEEKSGEKNETCENVGQTAQ
ncbi:TPA: CRISPR-associated RAMP protein Csx7 [Bacillus paranthracis]